MDKKPTYSEMKLIVSAKFRAMRHYLNFTQEKMAREIGISASALKKIERGVTLPSLDTFIQVRYYYGLSLEWLVLDCGKQYVKDRTKETLPKGAKKAIRLEDLDSGVVEMLEHMKQVPLLNYNILSYFHQFKLDNPSLFSSAPQEKP